MDAPKPKSVNYLLDQIKYNSVLDEFVFIFLDRMFHLRLDTSIDNYFHLSNKIFRLRIVL